MFSRHVYSMSVTPHSLSNTKLGLRLWNTIVKMLVKIIIKIIKIVKIIVKIVKMLRPVCLSEAVQPARSE